MVKKIVKGHYMKKFFISAFILLNFSFCSYASPIPSISPPSTLDAPTRFGLAFAQVKQFYVDDKSEKDIFENALRGMLAGLDPHSVYFDEADLADFMAQTEGSFVGIGVEITQESGAIKVISPLDGSPAQKAGIQPGDYIIAVNDSPILDMPINKIVKMLRGKAGTDVKITVTNLKNNTPRELMLKREQIKVEPVKAYMLDDGYAYMRISQFNESTAQLAKKNLQNLLKTNKIRGLVLDLRNNPGGLLDAAVDISDMFLDSNQLSKNKKIIYTSGRVPKANMSFDATAGDMLNGAPIVVLINQGSASASEVVAGALQDHHRAIIVGQKSFGKGSVQTLIPLDDKTAIKMTTALYYTPNGRSIQALGITPDIEIANLELTQNDGKDKIFSNLLSEKNLSGHLVNKQQTAATSNDAAITNLKKNNLASSDYPLYEAVNILKTLSVMQTKKGN